MKRCGIAAATPSLKIALLRPAGVAGRLRRLLGTPLPGSKAVVGLVSTRSNRGRLNIVSAWILSRSCCVVSRGPFMTTASLRPPETSGSTAVRQQHQTHPPLLERHAHLGERHQPEGVSDRPVAQRDRIRPIEIDVDGAVGRRRMSWKTSWRMACGWVMSALQRPLIGKSRSTSPDAFVPAGRLCGHLDLSLRIPRLLPLDCCRPRWGRLAISL